MASSLGLPSGVRPCAASESRGLILAAQLVIRPITSVKRERNAVNVRIRFINQAITQSWMKQQQFRMDSRTVRVSCLICRRRQAQAGYREKRGPGAPAPAPAVRAPVQTGHLHGTGRKAEKSVLQSR